MEILPEKVPKVSLLRGVVEWLVWRRKLSLYYQKYIIHHNITFFLLFLSNLLPFYVWSKGTEVRYAGYDVFHYVALGLIYLLSVDYSLEFAGRLRRLKEEGELEIVISSRGGVLRFLIYSLADSCAQSMIFVLIVLTISGLLDRSLISSTTFTSILASSIILLLASVGWFGLGLMMDAPFLIWEQKGRPATILLLLTGVFGEIYFPLENLSSRLGEIGVFVPPILFIRCFRQAFFIDNARSSYRIFLLIGISGCLALSLLMIGFLSAFKTLELARKQGRTGRYTF